MFLWEMNCNGQIEIVTPVFASGTFLGSQSLLHSYSTVSNLCFGWTEVVEKVIELKWQRALDETLSGPALG